VLKEKACSFYFQKRKSEQQLVVTGKLINPRFKEVSSGSLKM